MTWTVVDGRCSDCGSALAEMHGHVCSGRTPNKVTALVELSGDHLVLKVWSKDKKSISAGRFALELMKAGFEPGDLVEVSFRARRGGE